jgi:protease-4
MDSEFPSPSPPPPPPPRPHVAPPVIGGLVFQPPPPRKTGRGWMILALILMGLFALSTLGHLKNMVAGVTGRPKAGHTREMALEEVVLQDAENDSDNKIAVLEINGVIMSSPDRNGASIVALIEAQLKAAAKDKNIRAILLKIDSPGGEVLASDDIYSLLREFQLKHKDKPVIASMGGLAASGGYYVSAPCQYILANELTITGSIGVIMHGLNYRGLMDKIGLAPETFKSGKYKDMLSGEKEPGEIDPEEKKMVQTMIDQTFAKFKRIVAEGRAFAKERNGEKGRKLAADWEDYADGRILTARQAFDLGMIDKIGNFKEAIAAAKEIAGISDATLVEYEQPFDFTSLFRLFGKTEAPAIKIDLGIDMPKLQAGRPYYLLPMAVH